MKKKLMLLLSVFLIAVTVPAVGQEGGLEECVFDEFGNMTCGEFGSWTEEYTPSYHDCDSPFWHQFEDINADGIEDGCLKGPNSGNDCRHEYGGPIHQWNCIGGKCCSEQGGPILCVGGPIAGDSGYAQIYCRNPSSGQMQYRTVGKNNCNASLVGTRTGLYCFNDTNGDGKVSAGETVLLKATCSEVSW